MGKSCFAVFTFSFLKRTKDPSLCEAVAVEDFEATSLWTVLLLAFATFQYQSIPC